MTEVAGAGEHHGQTMFVGSSDDFLVAHRSPRLYDGLGTGRGQHIDAVTEREEGIGGDDRTVEVESGMLCLDTGDLGRIDAAHLAGADEVQVVDIIENELLNAQRKMPEFKASVRYLRQDAASVGLPDASVDANVVFFLLHELPHELKGVVLAEACRVLAPGGKLYLAEFHRPHVRVLRTLSWVYFKVFEPLGLALWNTHDPLAALKATPDIAHCERRTVFFGNFQVIVATKA